MGNGASATALCCTKNEQQAHPNKFDSPTSCSSPIPAAAAMRIVMDLCDFLDIECFRIPVIKA